MLYQLKFVASIALVGVQTANAQWGANAEPPLLSLGNHWSPDTLQLSFDDNIFKDLLKG